MAQPFLIVISDVGSLEIKISSAGERRIRNHFLG